MKYFKRFLAVIFVTSLMFTTSVFADTDYTYSESEVKASVESLVSELLLMDETELEYYTFNSVGWTQKACEELLSYAKNGTLGKLDEIKETKLKEDGQILVVTTRAKYENVDLNVVTTMAYITEQLTVTDVTFDIIDTSNTSMGEKMANAAFNTVIGIVSVFLVLLLISFVISLFKYIPKIQETFGRKKKGSVEEALENAIAHIEQKEELADDTELVAVITAAICAATGTSSDSFVVRSIKKADRKKKSR